MRAGGREQLRSVLVVWALATASGCSLLQPGLARPPVCLPDFPYAQGWLGGDGAYSVALPGAQAERRRATLWLFGDSFVGDPAQRDRQGARLVHNTIALSRCDARGQWQIDYHWGEDAQGEARALFEPAAANTSDSFYWLFDGFVHAGSLYVGLLEVRSDASATTLGFRLTGMQLARIANWRDDPRAWRIETSRLSESARAFPGSALVVRGEHLHLFAFSEMEAGRQPRFLTRLALDRIEAFPADLSGDLETWTGSAGWQPGLQPERAAILMDDNASEMSVEYDADRARWLAVYASPVQTGNASAGRVSDRVYVRTAEFLEGPWSQRSLLYLMPELQPDHFGGHQPDTFCYAAKAHRAFSPAGRLLLTYVCNLGGREGEDAWQLLERLERDMKLYRPQPVLLPLP